MGVGSTPVRVEMQRQNELRERSVAAARRPASPLEVAILVAVAFAIPAASAWGLAGIALSVALGGAMWLFERGRRRALQRESLLQLWRAIEDACCLDDVRAAARDAARDFDGISRQRLPQR